jgi:hypothetical protein
MYRSGVYNVFITIPPLHPQEMPEVIIEPARALALSATSEQVTGLRMHATTEDQLIFASSANWTGLALQLTTDCSDLANLFLHPIPSQ